MNRIMLTTSAVAMLATVALSGCATPSAALDHANGTAALIAQLEQEVEGFRRVELAAQEALIESMALQRRHFATIVATAELDDRARVAAGDTRAQVLRDTLLTSTDLYGRSMLSSQSGPAEYQKRVEGLMAPLPSPKADLTEAQKKSAAMGIELDVSVRRAELLAIAKGVRDSVKDAKKKISDAQEAAGKEQDKAEKDAKSSADTAKPANK